MQESLHVSLLPISWFYQGSVGCPSPKEEGVGGRPFSAISRAQYPCKESFCPTPGWERIILCMALRLQNQESKGQVHRRALSCPPHSAPSPPYMGSGVGERGMEPHDQAALCHASCLESMLLNATALILNHSCQGAQHLSMI